MGEPRDGPGERRAEMQGGGATLRVTGFSPVLAWRHTLMPVDPAAREVGVLPVNGNGAGT